MELPSPIIENRRARRRLEFMVAQVHREVAEYLEAHERREAYQLLSNCAWRHRLPEVEAATCILGKLGYFGHQMGIADPSLLEDVENYDPEVQRYLRHKMSLQEALDLICELINPAPLVRPVDTRGQSGFIHGNLAAGAGVRSFLHHRDDAVPAKNITTVGSRRCVLQDLVDSDLSTGDGRWNIGLPVFVANGGSSRILNWSGTADPSAGTGRGGSVGAHISIDAHALLLKYSKFTGEELRETESENSWARRILETTIGTLLPAAVVNARDFFGDAPDIVKLAGNMMLPALLGFCLIGMLHKRRAGRILRLATCAAIAAATFGVSSQLSDRIYAFIAVVVGVALSFTTLTA